MATIVINDATTIHFVNIDGAKKEDTPTLLISAGDWEIEQHIEPGIVFDVTGHSAPMLTAVDARKLAKWLNRAADMLEGRKNTDKKHKARHQRYEEDEDEFDKY